MSIIFGDVTIRTEVSWCGVSTIVTDASSYDMSIVLRILSIVSNLGTLGCDIRVVVVCTISCTS